MESGNRQSGKRSDTRDPKSKLSKSSPGCPGKVCILGLEAWGGMAQHPYTVLRALELTPQKTDIYFIGLRSGDTEKIYKTSLFQSGRVRISLVHYETDFSKKFRRLLLYVYNPFYYLKISRLIKNINPDLIHYTTGCTIEIFIAAFFNRSIKAKLISFHDPSPHDESNVSPLKRMNNKIYYIIKKYCLKKIPYVHVNAHSHVCQIATHFHVPESHIFPTHMVSNVVDEFCTRKTQPKELANLQDNTHIKILFLGRIRPYKGVEVLLRAVEGLSKSHYKLQLIVAGEGKIYFDCQSVRDSLLLINRYIDNSEVSALFNASDFVVLPYRSATQSGILSLSCFFSKPVIATAVGGIPELIIDGKTGFLVQPGDAYALENKIRYFIEHPADIKRMGKQAREYYQAHYSFEALSKELWTIYCKIMDYI